MQPVIVQLPVKEKTWIQVQGAVTPVPTMTPIPVPAVPQTFVGTVEIYGKPIQSGGTSRARIPEI